MINIFSKNQVWRFWKIDITTSVYMLKQIFYYRQSIENEKKSSWGEKKNEALKMTKATYTQEELELLDFVENKKLDSVPCVIEEIQRLRISVKEKTSKMKRKP